MRVLFAAAVSAWVFRPQALPANTAGAFGPAAALPAPAGGAALAPAPVLFLQPPVAAASEEASAAWLLGAALLAAAPVAAAALWGSSGRPVASSRREVLAAALAAAAGASSVAPAAAEEAAPDAPAAPAAEPAPAPPAPPPPPAKVQRPSGLSYEVIKAGTEGGGSPVVGDLIAVRFKCQVKSSGVIIDNIMDSPEPYYYRVGSGQVLPAVEEAVKLMRSGDVWALTVPPALGFGPKGRSASPGKPRIPGDAILDFTLELVAVPGKDEEILDANGIID